MHSLQTLFPVPWPVIGVLHLLPLPGSPRWGGDWEEVRTHLLREADTLLENGIHGLMLENFGDAPFTRDRVEPATIAAMALLAGELSARTDRPIGLNVLRNDAMSALSIATLTGARFIRVNVLIGAMLTDQGVIEGRARELHLLRRQLGWPGQVWADVLVKHASPLAPLEVEQVAKDTVARGMADVLIASGTGTGEPTPVEKLRRVRAAVPGIPVLAGSGVNRENLAAIRQACDGCIVATSLQDKGRYDGEKVRAFMERVGSGQSAVGS